MQEWKPICFTQHERIGLLLILLHEFNHFGLQPKLNMPKPLFSKYSQFCSPWFRVAKFAKNDLTKKVNGFLRNKNNQISNPWNQIFRRIYFPLSSFWVQIERISKIRSLKSRIFKHHLPKNFDPFFYKGQLELLFLGWYSTYPIVPFVNKAWRFFQKSFILIVVDPSSVTSVDS